MKDNKYTKVKKQFIETVMELVILGDMKRLKKELDTSWEYAFRLGSEAMKELVDNK